MKDDAKSQLKKLLATYDERLAEVERVAAAKRAADAAFPARFATLTTETIRPALQEFAVVLNDRGHVAAVREQEESSSTAGGVSLATISLRIVPKGPAPKASETSKSFVEISFMANRTERRITVSSTNTMFTSGGNVGKRGDYEVDAVTADVVVGHVLQTLEEAFAGTR